MIRSDPSHVQALRELDLQSHPSSRGTSSASGRCAALQCGIFVILFPSVLCVCVLV